MDKKAAMKVSYVVGCGDDRGSFQGDWPEVCECVHCGKTAMLVFATVEDSGLDEYLCDRHINVPDNDAEGYWFHDATAWAVYICRRCFGATAKWNQA